MQDVISIRDFSREDLDLLIIKALELKRKRPKVKIPGTAASLFFENSTRTRTSSEKAAINLGMKVIGFAGSEGTSVQKGEPLIDTARMYERYKVRTITIRHNLTGSARFLADNLKTPIINAGDGSGNHPTQTMLDLVTIKEKFGKIDGLTIALVGDLKFGRTVHSMLQAAELYNVNIWLVSPKSLAMPKWRIEDYEKATNKKVIVSDDLLEAINNVDVLYMTRIQRERFPEGSDGEFEFKKVSGVFNLKKRMLSNAKKDMIVMHPLPRYKERMEISTDVDNTPHAAYIDQAENGLYTREAILITVLSKGFTGKTQKKNDDQGIWKDLQIINGQKSGRNFLYRLENGTLIDHIEPNKGHEVLKVLNLEEEKENTIVHAINMFSTQFGRKDVIGVKDAELSDEQLSRLGLVSSRARVNIVRDGKVTRKGTVNLPTVLEGFVQCQTPSCITRPEHNEFAPSIFYVEKQNPLSIRCHYCETPISREEIVLL